MQTLQYFILGLVQGITEFLPISSDGHLNLFQHLFGMTPSLTLDIFLHAATFLSVVFFFRKKLKFFFGYLPQIIVGSIPAVIAGFFLKDKIEELASKPQYLPFLFLLTGIMVFATKFIKTKDKKITFLMAFIIGLFQAFAILPAVSRSGGTIFSALLLGVSPVNAFNFSFCLFLPAGFGAILLELKDILSPAILTPINGLVFLFTFLVGVASLKILEKVITGNKFWMFGVYVFILSGVLFFVL